MALKKKWRKNTEELRAFKKKIDSDSDNEFISIISSEEKENFKKQAQASYLV